MLLFVLITSNILFICVDWMLFFTSGGDVVCCRFALCCCTANLLSYSTVPRLNVSTQNCGGGDSVEQHFELTGQEEWLHWLDI